MERMEDPPPCMDCKEQPATVTVRARKLCPSCLLRFLSSKVVRRMERYRPRLAPKDHRRRLLLPLSYGPGSLVLLSILNNIIHRQMTSGKKQSAFDLLVLNVDTGSTEGEGSHEPGTGEQGRLSVIRNAFPNAAYSEIPFESIFEYDADVENVLADLGWRDTEDDPTSASSSPASENERKKNQTNLQKLNAFRSTLSSPTTAADMEHILLVRLIIAFAKQKSCEAVLWGDCDSTLAAKALAGVSKGRGGLLPWTVSDGPTPLGVYYNFPMRDIFKSELLHYVEASLELQGIREKGAMDWQTLNIDDDVSNRHMSIERLMSTYVETHAERYPGVMANIVRTVAKLHGAQSEGDKCAFCGLPIGNERHMEELRGHDPARQLSCCYGCERSAKDIKPLHS